MSIVRSTFRYDPSGWRPVGAILRGLGVALSAVVGERVGGHGAAVLAGVGALYAGIASFGGVHQARLRRMIWAIGAATLTTLVGSLVEPSDALTIAAVVGITLVLAIFAEGGPDAAQVALLGTGTLIVFSGLRGAASQPFENAALVLAGGVGQAIILMLVHPFSPVSEERHAVEAVYRSLSEYARSRAAGVRTSPLPNGETTAAARTLLREGFRYGSPPERRKLWSELELAESLRGNLAGLDRVEVRPATWQALGDWLAAAAATVGEGRPIERRLPVLDCLPSSAPWLDRIQRTVEAEEEGRLPIVAPVPSTWFVAFGNVVSLRRAVLGHALRYTVAIGLATAGYRLLKVDHGYWAPLSLAFSLKPDFAGTVTKGLGRIAGTIAGVVLSTIFVTLLHPSANALTAAMLLAAWVAFALLNAFYVGYSAALAFYVVVSIVLAGATVRSVGVERIGATAAGSAFALFVSLVWPRWEAGKARMALAVAFATQAEYAERVLAHGSSDDLAEMRHRARTARLEAERLVSAAAFEPKWGRGRHLEGAEAALARLAENAARMLAAHVGALETETQPLEDLRRLAAEDRSIAADLMG